ncbi:hypothetical protein ACEWY4_026358 [Coilia grayii]|uniref:G-protein coupled receptors family 1 profile domain-containing protein n=1 Tax=Coilia grayii TaxID=363190 RepID=A0ABD1IUN2_9TELE
MGSTAFFVNGTSAMNATEDLDLFCVTLLAGPLIWAIFSVPCVCVGVPASVCLLWVLVQRQRSGLSNNIYMINLTVMDLIYNVFKLPGVLNFLVWRDHQVLKLMYILEGFNLNGRPLFMACSCVDCYVAVVSPVKYMKLSQSRYRPAVCALVWAFTLVFDLLFGFHSNLLHYCVWGMPRLLAVSTITFCDFVVLRALRKPDPSGKTDVHPQKQRALQTITNSFIMTVASYLPPLLVQMHTGLIPLSPQEMYCHINTPSLIFSMLGSTLLPLLCLVNLGRLKDLRICNCI